MTVDDAVASLQENNVIQPALFFLDGQPFVKLDRKAIALDEPSCFADLIDFLLKCYYVFGVEYPYPLRLVYGLLETVMGIPVSIGKSTLLSDFIRAIKLR